MRYFNTSGPCYPEKHYTVMREDLIAEGMARVHNGRYVTIFAPRQAGKTTFFRLLIKELQKEGRFVPTWISFEIHFSIHHPDISYLYAHGVVENINGIVDVDVPYIRKPCSQRFVHCSMGKRSIILRLMIHLASTSMAMD